MSLSYKIITLGLKCMGTKKLFQMSEDELLKKVEKMNRKRQFKLPTDSRASYTDSLIFGKYHCLKIGAKKAKQDKVILFLYGGAMMLGSDAGDLKVAVDIGQKTGSDIWFLHYPLCPGHNMREIYEVVYETYRMMLEDYKAQRVSLLGFSSGAALAIGLCLYNTANGSILPMPRQVIACSPGAVPLSGGEKEKMQALSQKDLLVDAAYMSKIRKFMEGGERLPDYMLTGSYGDFTDFPKTVFYYGSDEVLYAEADYYEAAFKKYDARCEIHVGKGMCHCYPMFPYFPEAKQAYHDIVQKLTY